MVDWNAKYGAVDTLLYGERPSDIINKAKSEYADRLGHVLCLGDGEGRQSRALVSSGFTVTAIDISAVATNRALKRDKEDELVIKRLIYDVSKPPPLQQKLAVVLYVICIFLLRSGKAVFGGSKTHFQLEAYYSLRVLAQNNPPLTLNIIRGDQVK